MAIEVDNEVPEKLNHNHPSFLNSTDNSGTVLISLQLTGSENYSVWRRAMRIAILGRNMLGFIDGTCKKEKFDPNLTDLWERYNAIGTNSIAAYFSKLCLLWDEFDALAPSPCDCPRSRDYVEFMKRQKLLQLFMGLNESYE
ncbi:uncharacterized protein LOC142172025 [Nicotiana tabacum]|uniref:Uncharacterized protein LOC142172025 n=1 Tax=Nicotiana tabacum TaxID=4097 RepID=A0AC58T3R1_TOBAC